MPTETSQTTLITKEENVTEISSTATSENFTETFSDTQTNTANENTDDTVTSISSNTELKMDYSQ